ncbi:MFS transporter [Aerosakkonemataceae cyanobacterium BLCC-F50]|uniref:MFS transporter n=1 Tax=Floridaenema flaviceps BLCC-F50 TaxID=3153642 RepID=A0ABV4XKY8_9CYAN
MASAIMNPQRDRGRWMVLFACIVAVLMVAIDSGILNMIVPAIQKDLNAPQATIGLLSSISTLMLAAFILGGGTLGDIYGRRRLILIGTGGIVASAILSMLASSTGALIGIRAMDGVCQALVNPLALAIITVTFDKEERPKAIGIYGATLGIMGGFSSLLIQYFNQAFGWRSVFTLVIGLGFLTIFLMLRFVSESKAAGSHKLDWLGILLCAIGLFALIYGISQASGAGGFFSAGVLIPGIIGLIILGIFIWWEARVESPALELSLFQKPAFSLGTLLILLFSFAQTGVFFHLSNYLQVLLKESPVNSALMLLPLTLALFVFNIISGTLVNRFQIRSLIVTGTLMFALAMFLFSRLISPDLTVWTLLIPMLLLGAGMAIANIPRMNALLSSAPPTLAGVASATNNAFMQLGNAMGVAVTVALVTSFGRNYYLGELTKAGLNEERIRKVNELLQKVLSSDVPSIASQFAIPKQQLKGLVGNYQAAFTIGVTQMMLVSALALLLAAILSWFWLRSYENSQR